MYLLIGAGRNEMQAALDLIAPNIAPLASTVSSIAATPTLSIESGLKAPIAQSSAKRRTQSPSEAEAVQRTESHKAGPCYDVAFIDTTKDKKGKQGEKYLANLADGLSFEENRAMLSRYVYLDQSSSIEPSLPANMLDTTGITFISHNLTAVAKARTFTSAPSPTINTKEAMADVLNMFSQPLNQKEEVTDLLPDETISSKVFKREVLSGASLGVFHDSLGEADNSPAVKYANNRKPIILLQNDENASGKAIPLKVGDKSEAFESKYPLASKSLEFAS